MLFRKETFFKAHSLTGSFGEIAAELSGLREAEEHGQQSRDNQGQRAGNYTRNTNITTKTPVT